MIKPSLCLRSLLAVLGGVFIAQTDCVTFLLWCPHSLCALCLLCIYFKRFYYPLSYEETVRYKKNTDFFLNGP